MTVPMPPQPPLVDARNAEMASAWNGAEGADWAARADRFDAASAAFDPALLSAACAGLVVVRVTTSDWRAPLLAGALLAGILLLYALYRPKSDRAA